MTNWNETSEESKKRWENNADFWDERMGEYSNSFHREIIRPATEELLGIKPDDAVLDIACGNGNFSKRLVELGAKVTAFDYSANMIENAKKRCSHYLDSIDFKVMDATKYDELMTIGQEKFHKAVANMALMDIADINPLLKAVYNLLKPGGVFVFSITHPCFQTAKIRKIVETEDLGDRVVVRNSVQIFNYITPQQFEGIGIIGQPLPQIYYHRPLYDLLGMCFKAGFVVDGLKEPVFDDKPKNGKFEWNEIPPALIVRLLKI